MKYNEAITLKNMDLSIDPREDFYNYVNAGWQKQVEIPEDKSMWSGFSELTEQNNLKTLKLLDKLTNQKHNKGTEGQKIADIYASYMDLKTRNHVGIKPIMPILKEIESIRNMEQLQGFYLKHQPYGMPFLYGFYFYAHRKKSSENALYLGGPSLGLDRSYYQKEDTDAKEKRELYKKHVARMLSFLDVEKKQADQKATAILAFEKRLTQHMLPKEFIRDANKTYNPRAVKDLKVIVPTVDLVGYLRKSGVKSDSVIIAEIAYYEDLSNIIKQENLPVIKDYLKWHLVRHSAAVLSFDIDEANFDFYGRVLRGTPQQEPLNKRALIFINQGLGEALGKVYVSHFFSPKAKQSAQEMVDYLRKSYAIHINNLSWMGEKTKEKALEKLNKISVKIGYPDKWKSYEDMDIKSGEKGGNLFEIKRQMDYWAHKQNMAKQSKPVDKSEWHMSPQTVNAYYSPSYNEIVFPAAILQPPFFNPDADAAVNFGGMGAVIGHEISHAFDDSGALFDADGNLKNWWTEQDKLKFKALGVQLQEQYSAYEVLPGVFVNGKTTLGENIADLGGVTIAYDALELYLKDKGNPGLIQNLSPQQRFFISWATIWRTKAREQALKNQVKVDPHSPGYFRAIGPLFNVDGYHKAFQVRPTDKMYKAPQNRIKIW